MLTSTLHPTANAKARPLPRADLTDRPVQPGQTALPTYLPNNAPPVFAPQKLN